jgi:hypothetical protein
MSEELKLGSCYEFKSRYLNDFEYLGEYLGDEYWDDGEHGYNVVSIFSKKTILKSEIFLQETDFVSSNFREKFFLRETECQKQYPIKKLFFVFGAGCDYTKSYEDILKEFKRMENIIMEELDIPYSTLKNIDSILKNYKGNELKFLLKYKDIRNTVEFVRELQSNSGLHEENVHLKCYPYSTINITKSYLGLSPLKRFTRSGWRPSNIIESLCEEIIQSSDTHTDGSIVVMGHSYGGAIINRAAMAMSNLETKYKNVHFIGFGSIYVPTHVPSNVNLLNYLSLGDVAMKTNGLSHNIPLYSRLNKVLYSALGYEPDIVCTFQNESSINSVRWVCLFENNEPLCLNNEKQRKISVVDWREHTYRKLIMNILHYNSPQCKTTFISDILLFKTISEYTPIQPKTNAFMRFLSRGSAGGKKHSKATRKKHF